MLYSIRRLAQRMAVEGNDDNIKGVSRALRFRLYRCRNIIGYAVKLSRNQLSIIAHIFKRGI